MERTMAYRILSEVKKNVQQLTIEEVMAMTKIKTDDNNEVYAIQKGDVTLLARIGKCGYIIGPISIKIQCW